MNIHKAVNYFYKLASALNFSSPREAAEVLNVPLSISEDDLKKIYRAKVLQFHPDRNPGLNGDIEIKKINKAYEILKKYLFSIKTQQKNTYERDNNLKNEKELELSSNPNTDPEILEKLFNENQYDSNILLNIAKNPSSTFKLIKKILFMPWPSKFEDISLYVILMALEHHSIPKNVLEKLKDMFNENKWPKTYNGEFPHYDAKKNRIFI